MYPFHSFLSGMGFIERLFPLLLVGMCTYGLLYAGELYAFLPERDRGCPDIVVETYNQGNLAVSDSADIGHYSLFAIQAGLSFEFN